MEPAIQFTSEMTVSYIQHMGTDHLFAEAARQSNNRTGSDPSVLVDEIRDTKLINKLLPQRHTSPFEHSGLTVAVHVPLFVSREWERHRTQSYSEMSLRYSVADPVFWLPDMGHGVMDVGTKMKPKRGWPNDEPDLDVLQNTGSILQVSYELAWRYYQEQLELGVHQEVARACLPLGLYTRFWATANAINWLRFLSLRTHEPDAAVVSYPQFEIEQAARQVERIFEFLWPVTYAAWVKAGRAL